LFFKNSSRSSVDSEYVVVGNSNDPYMNMSMMNDAAKNTANTVRNFLFIAANLPIYLLNDQFSFIFFSRKVS
jgi:hypothetical protein